MNVPNIRFYAKLENSTKENGKTPKYTIIEKAGYYEPMEALRDKSGLISFYLMEKLKEGLNVPSMRLQAKGSLNFTGLKDYFVDGKLSGFAYGYPYDRMTYSSKNKINPFFDYKDDGFLFIVHSQKQTDGKVIKVIPESIELIVLEGAKVLISSYCKQLSMGGFDDALQALRKQVKREMPL